MTRQCHLSVVTPTKLQAPVTTTTDKATQTSPEDSEEPTRLPGPPTTPQGRPKSASNSHQEPFDPAASCSLRTPLEDLQGQGSTVMGVVWWPCAVYPAGWGWGGKFI